MTENVIDNLIKDFQSGKIKTAEFKNNLYQIINNHTTQQIQSAIGNEYYVFIRDTFKELYIKYMTLPVDVETVIPDDLAEGGDLMCLGDKVVTIKSQYNWWQLKISFPSIPTYHVDKNKYALRMAYTMAHLAFNFFRNEKSKEEAERQKALKRYQEEMEAKKPKEEVKTPPSSPNISKKKHEK